MIGTSSMAWVLRPVAVALLASLLSVGNSYFVWHDGEYHNDDSKSCTVVCTQHKCGTYNLLQTMDRYHQTLPSVVPDHEPLPQCSNGDLAFFLNIKTMVPAVQFDYSQARAMLMIRHPLDVVVSSHRFHLTAGEKWLHVPQENGLTYQEELNTMNKTEGIMFEMTQGAAYLDTVRLLEFLESPEAAHFRLLKLEQSKYSPHDFADELALILGLDADKLRPIVVDELSYDKFREIKHLSPVDGELIEQIRGQELYGATYPYEFGLHLECEHYLAFEEIFGIKALRILGYGDSVKMYKAAKAKQCGTPAKKRKRRKRRRKSRAASEL